MRAPSRYVILDFFLIVEKENIQCRILTTGQYWNWFANQDDLSKSPVFDGSDYSMSGDGAFFQHNGSLSGTNNIFIPSGNGGGCITSGPFKE